MPGENSSSGEGGYILFVDDEKPAREALSELLTACGFKVLLAESHRSAVSVLGASEEVEAVICDLKAPGKSGLEVLRYINKEKKNIPVIFLIGHGTLEACREAFREGAFDYILKPVDNIDKLTSPLKHAVKEYRLEKENRQMLRDILRMAQEHEKILGELLADVETKGKVHKRISRILDRWKEDH